MRLGGRASALLVALAVALAVPAAAWGHATLLATQPQASGVLSQPPTEVRLTYSERVEPRFAVISVTDAHGAQQIAGSPARSANDPNTIFVPIKRVSQGWYLVWWRVISADGHPVRGAFTFAVGPSPGPPPQFVIPSLGESAATPDLVGSRWVLLLSMLAAIGLLAFRGVVARPLQVTGDSERALRSVTSAAAIALGIALVAAPVYLLLATAEFSIRPWTDIGEIVPLVRDSGFGRAFSDPGPCSRCWRSPPQRPWRSTGPGASTAPPRPCSRSSAPPACAAAALVFPGLGGHPSTTSPVGTMLALDWAHLAAASIWIGGLVGLLVLAAATEAGHRVGVLAVVVPRFSRVAMGSVAVLLAHGHRRQHRPPAHARFAVADGLRAGADREERAARVRARARRGQHAALAPAARRRGGAQRPGARRRCGPAAATARARRDGAARRRGGGGGDPHQHRAALRGARACGQGGRQGGAPPPVAHSFTRNGVRIQVGIEPNRAAIDNAFALRLERAGSRCATPA